MKTDRKELLSRLLSLTPGIVKRATVQQSDAVAFRRGRMYSCSQEVFCTIASLLPEEIEGAVRADKLIALLKQMPEDFLTVRQEEKALTLIGEDRKARLTLDAEILLPIDGVEKPAEWQKMPADLEIAVNLVTGCTKKKGEFLQECIHIHPDYLEASDNMQIARWRMNTGVALSVLVRAESIQEMCSLGMTKMSETKNWLHFRNPLGLHLSVRKWKVEDYPDFTPFLEVKGKKITLPSTLNLAADRAGVLADEDVVHVRIQGKELTLRSRSVEGDYFESQLLKHNGCDVHFAISYGLIDKVLKKSCTCWVSETSLRVDTEDYTYLTSLEAKDQ